MRKELGITILLLALCVVTTALNPKFLSPTNLVNTANLIGLYGVFSLGAGLVIISGGVDLSVGSLCALTGVLLTLGVSEWHWSWPVAVGGGLLLAALLGAAHGWLVTRARLPPFIVTLCGLLIYRGAARYLAGDRTTGFSGAGEIEELRRIAAGRLFRLTVPSESGAVREWFPGLPAPFVILLILTVGLWFVLHRSVYGRYLFAVGRNEQAARFSGVNTRLVIASAYVIAGTLTGLAGILIAFYTNSVVPSNHGNFYELYGIAAAVLGGCSLRGGEGSVPGIVIGTALLLVLQNLVNLLGIDSSLNFAVMGAVVLAGGLLDQWIQRRKLRRASARSPE